MTNTTQATPAALSAGNITGAAERWIRIPSKGYCPNTGLSRSHLFALIAEGEIKSRSLKKPGNTRGPRLVWLPSVFEYIERAGVE